MSIWRLFVAVYPPRDSAAALLRALKEIPHLPPHRPTPVEQIHLTAQFIGDTSEREFGHVRESIDRSCAGISSFLLVPRRLITLPERGLSRLVAAETDLPAELAELHRRLAHRLAKHPRGREPERFHPHLTLARFAGGGDPFRLDAPCPCPGFRVMSVSLVRSHLGPGGASHREIDTFPLGCEKKTAGPEGSDRPEGRNWVEPTE